MYGKHLDELGASSGKRIHSTDFKIKLMKAIPELEENKGPSPKDGIYLSFNLAKEIKKLKTNENQDREATILREVALIIRKEIFNTRYKFQGSIVDEQYNNIPSSLSMLDDTLWCGFDR